MEREADVPNADGEQDQGEQDKLNVIIDDIELQLQIIRSCVESGERKRTSVEALGAAGKALDLALITG